MQVYFQMIALNHLLRAMSAYHHQAIWELLLLEFLPLISEGPLRFLLLGFRSFVLLGREIKAL